MEKRGCLLIKISKLFIPYTILLLIIGFKGELLISFLLVFFHELAHYLIARKLGFKGFHVEILPIGTVLKLKDLDDADPKEDLIISISGPITNLIMAGIFYFINKKYSNYYFNLLYISNLTLGIFNLIPAFPLDGGRILRDILALKTFYKKANKITVNVSLIIGFFITTFSLIVLELGKKNLSIGIIGLFIVISSYKEKERIVYIIMGDIIRKKYRFIKRGYIENRNLSIYYKRTLLEALSILDKNRYNIFTVLNEDMKVISTIYEEELVEGLKLYGNVSLEDYLKNIDKDEIEKMDKLAKLTVEEWNNWNDNSMREE